jgi:hypothetical protein
MDPLRRWQYRADLVPLQVSNEVPANIDAGCSMRAAEALHQLLRPFS